MIDRIAIHGYKGLSDVVVDLEPVTVLIGKSGTGKSNFLEAIRFLRDIVSTRNIQQPANDRGGWNNLFTITHSSPRSMTFGLTFRIEGIPEAFVYELRLFQHGSATGAHPPGIHSEKLQLGSKVLFHHENSQWHVPPNVAAAPMPTGILLGGIAGLQESALAYSALAYGLSCHRFSDRVLETTNESQQPFPLNGLQDSGSNYVSTFAQLYLNLQHWKSLKQIEAALRTMKPSLASITVNQPENNTVSTAHELPGYPRLVFDIGRESEGFRRLFTCLLALYQRPSKQTLLFDEPEKGVYPAALALLAEEFKACAETGRGQVILATHSPDFLDHFQPEQIRVVEMENFETRIGLMEQGQSEAIHERYLRPGELLTVDQARIFGAADPEPAQ